MTTAVQQLYKDLCDCGAIEWPDDPLALQRMKDAMKVEKQQIINAFKMGCNRGLNPSKDAKLYYRVNYGGDQ